MQCCVCAHNVCVIILKPQCQWCLQAQRPSSLARARARVTTHLNTHSKSPGRIPRVISLPAFVLCGRYYVYATSNNTLDRPPERRFFFPSIMHEPGFSSRAAEKPPREAGGEIPDVFPWKEGNINRPDAY